MNIFTFEHWIFLNLLKRGSLFSIKFTSFATTEFEKKLTSFSRANGKKNILKGWIFLLLRKKLSRHNFAGCFKTGQQVYLMFGKLSSLSFWSNFLIEMNSFSSLFQYFISHWIGFVLRVQVEIQMSKLIQRSCVMFTNNFPEEIFSSTNKTKQKS